MKYQSNISNDNVSKLLLTNFMRKQTRLSIRGVTWSHPVNRKKPGLHISEILADIHSEYDFKSRPKIMGYFISKPSSSIPLAAHPKCLKANQSSHRGQRYF
jgi:hypothetical protein